MQDVHRFLVLQSRYLALAACVLAVPACTNPDKLSEATLAGTWSCAPVVTQKDGMSLSLVERDEYRGDHSFERTSTATISAAGQERPLVISSRGSGTWSLTDFVLTRRELQAEFLKSSDPRFTKETGQRMEDEALRKQPVNKLRIAAFDRAKASFVVMDYKGPGEEFRLDCTRATSP